MPRKYRDGQYNLNDIRDALAEVIDKLRDNSITPAVANATSNAIAQVLTSVRIEMTHQERTGRVIDGIKMLESGQ